MLVRQTLISRLPRNTFNVDSAVVIFRVLHAAEFNDIIRQKFFKSRGGLGAGSALGCRVELETCLKPLLSKDQNALNYSKNAYFNGTFP